MRLAGWRKRPGFRGLLEACFGETPIPARETRALPNLPNIRRRFYSPVWSRVEFWSGQATRICTDGFHVIVEDSEESLEYL